MDPLAVLKTLWHYKSVTLPVLFITLIASVYVFQFAPRSYESTTTYALINPNIPTEADKTKNPALKDLNSSNPYLRSSDPTLVVQVLITRLKDSSTADQLTAEGLSKQYDVTRDAVGGQYSFLVDITGVSSTPDRAIATTRRLGELLTEDLRTIQKIDGADDTYLFSSLVVASADKATEQFSSRLRSLIAVLVGGAVLMFGAVSIARGLGLARRKKAALHAAAASDAGGRPEHDSLSSDGGSTAGGWLSPELDAIPTVRGRRRDPGAHSRETREVLEAESVGEPSR
ncbi:chain-length determining protein [Arthrobacter sp. NPDC080073]|uniref:chain-length determining protein n=1 Tax=Arthrobacter sp. NPDC080073 TaxID=3155919 RepID=UPI00342C7904